MQVSLKIPTLVIGPLLPDLTPLFLRLKSLVIISPSIPTFPYTLHHCRLHTISDATQHKGLVIYTGSNAQDCKELLQKVSLIYFPFQRELSSVLINECMSDRVVEMVEYIHRVLQFTLPRRISGLLRWGQKRGRFSGL